MDALIGSVTILVMGIIQEVHKRHEKMVRFQLTWNSYKKKFQSREFQAMFQILTCVTAS